MPQCDGRAKKVEQSAKKCTFQLRPQRAKNEIKTARYNSILNDWDRITTNKSPWCSAKRAREISEDIFMNPKGLKFILKS